MKCLAATCSKHEASNQTHGVACWKVTVLDTCHKTHPFKSSTYLAFSSLCSSLSLLSSSCK